MSDQAYYLTDDRDLPEEDLRALVIFRGGNNDWYVQVTGKNGRSTEGVRICTSGGASTHCPGLPLAISDAYRAMRATERGERLDPRPSRDELEAELEAWRAKYPNQGYRFGVIEDVVG